MKIRTTEAERAEWHAKARSVGLSLSDLVCRSVGRVRTWTVAHTELELERTRELARIGSNLNQIARWANIHKENAGSELQGDGRSIARGVNAIWKRQQQARERQRGPERDYGPSR